MKKNICERCKKEFNVLNIVPTELRFLMKFGKLCAKCDKKIRMDWFEDIEMINEKGYYYWKKVKENERNRRKTY